MLKKLIISAKSTPNLWSLYQVKPLLCQRIYSNIKCNKDISYNLPNENPEVLKKIFLETCLELMIRDKIVFSNSNKISGFESNYGNLEEDFNEIGPHEICKLVVDKLDDRINSFGEVSMKADRSDIIGSYIEELEVPHHLVVELFKKIKLSLIELLNTNPSIDNTEKKSNFWIGVVGKIEDSN